MAQSRLGNRYRRASHLYNESWREVQMSQVSAIMDTKRTKLRHSRKMPPWLASVLDVLFGLADEPGYKPRFSTFLYVLSCSLAAVWIATSTFFLVYDVQSNNTTSTIFTGTADVVLGGSWGMLGVYAQGFGRRILRNRALSDNIRMHTRTIFKVNAALASLFVSAAALGIHMYKQKDGFSGQHCELIQLNPLVCKVRYVSNCAYSCLVLFWNVIVASIAMSMCRTFTIVCRRFIRELEHEGKLLEKIYRLRLLQRSQELEGTCPGPGLLWGSEDGLQMVLPSNYMGTVDSEVSDDDMVTPPEASKEASEQAIPHDPTPTVPPQSESGSISQQELRTISGLTEEAPRSIMRKLSRSQTLPAEMESQDYPSSVPRVFQDIQHESPDEIKRLEKLLFTEEDLCSRYWKINCQLRITSLVFQRWMGTWMAFVTFWAFSYIVYWLNNKADFLELFYFALPIFLVALMCSAYAEVNLESSRIVYSVCPRAGRLTFNRFINSQPAYLMVFAMPMTYQVIIGIVAAFAVAFASRIIMDEFNKT